jgi:hypothetical protein
LGWLRIARGTAALAVAAVLAGCGHLAAATAPPLGGGPASTLATTNPFPSPSTTAIVPSTTTTVPAPVRAAGSPRVLLYGDSIAWEAHNAFEFLLPGDVVKIRTFWGTAICDWFSYMQADTASFQPDVVVAEFAGVDFSPCLTARAPAGSSPAVIAAAFRTDAIKATAILSVHGAEVIWIGAPIDLGNPDQTLQHMYASLPSFVPHSAYTDAGDAVAPGEVFTWTMPCLPHEPTCNNGTVVVRSPDGRHLCPVKTTLVTCPVWSGGAFRFAGAMASAASAYLHTVGL